MNESQSFRTLIALKKIFHNFILSFRTMQRGNLDWRRQISPRISDKAGGWFGSLSPRIFPRISVLNHSSASSVVPGDIWWDTPYITHLSTIYLILNYLSACHIFNPESSTYLSYIQSWITCLPGRHSILNYLPAPRIQCFFVLEMHWENSDLLPWKCTENAVLCCLENASGMQCFFALKIHRECSAFLPWKYIEDAVLFCLENASRIQCFFDLKNQELLCHNIYLPFQLRSQIKLKFINRINSFERQLAI